MSELIIFAANLSLYQEVLSLVVKYDVDFLGPRAADVGAWRDVVLGAWFWGRGGLTEHDVVVGFAMHVGLV